MNPKIQEKSQKSQAWLQISEPMRYFHDGFLHGKVISCNTSGETSSLQQTNNSNKEQEQGPPTDDNHNHNAGTQHSRVPTSLRRSFLFSGPKTPQRLVVLNRRSEQLSALHRRGASGRTRGGPWKMLGATTKHLLISFLGKENQRLSIFSYC